MQEENRNRKVAFIGGCKYGNRNKKQQVSAKTFLKNKIASSVG